METFDFLKLAKKRYACRKYSDRQVEPEKLARILEAGRVAPTGANRQPQRLVVVQSKEGMEKTGALHARFQGSDGHRRLRRHLRGVDPQIRRFKMIGDIDASIVTDHMMLCAASLGARHAVDLHVQARGRARGVRAAPARGAVNILLVGYGDGTPVRSRRHDTQRKPLDETVFHEHF